MKRLSIGSITLFLLVFMSDISKWALYNHSFRHHKTTECKEIFKDDGVKIYKNNNFNIFVFNPKKHIFGVSSEKPSNKTFYMNSNFFNKDAIGLVVENGVKKSSRVKGGGFFYVSNNKVNINKGYCPKKVDYASQTILWGVNKGKINNYVIKQKHAKVHTYRNIVGKNKKGEIVFIVSNFGGFVTIKEIINEGIKHGLIDAILFDGGSSVDYEFKNNDKTISFKSVSNLSKKIFGIKQPTTYLYVD